MKTLLVLLAVVLAVAYTESASIDAHLFDGLVHELMKMLRSLNHNNMAISQSVCINDCNNNLGLTTTMCSDICIEAAKTYPNSILSQ